MYNDLVIFGACIEFVPVFVQIAIFARQITRLAEKELNRIIIFNILLKASKECMSKEG